LKQPWEENRKDKLAIAGKPSHRPESNRDKRNHARRRGAVIGAWNVDFSIF
jgi:hypothetical protein